MAKKKIESSSVVENNPVVIDESRIPTETADGRALDRNRLISLLREESVYQDSGPARKPCPQCTLYMHARKRQCPACDYNFPEPAAKSQVNGTVSVASTPRDIIQETMEATVRANKFRRFLEDHDDVDAALVTFNQVQELISLSGGAKTAEALLKMMGEYIEPADR